MAKQRFSQRDITSNKIGCYIPINDPDGNGGYITKMISVSNLLNISTDAIKFQNVTNSGNVLISGNSLLNILSINKVSGSPVVRIGTTLYGEEIMSDQEITDDVFLNKFEMYLNDDTNVYYYVQGGNVNIRIDYSKNFF